MDWQKIINDKLQKEFSPVFLEVLNESQNHNVPQGSQSHFRVTLVSDGFNGKALLQRHRQVNKLLADALERHIHALALHTFTVEEWEAKGQHTETSPPCQGGGK